MALNFLGLEAFLSIAERGSIRKAAAHLNLSQTALSHRIRKFEEGLGTRLLARTTRQVTLTPAGLELAARARDPAPALPGSGRKDEKNGIVPPFFPFVAWSRGA